MTTARGIRRIPTINGSDLSLPPTAITPSKQRLVTDVRTEGDSFRYGHAPLAGLPTHEVLYQFSLPYDSVDDDVLDELMDIEEIFDELTLAIWKKVRARYIATEGQTDFYVPRRRLNAPNALTVPGVDEATYPVTVTRSVTAQAVTMVTGTGVSVPAAGACNFARSPVASGDYRDYTQFKLSACSAGDVIILDHYPCFRVRVIDASESYPGGFRETRELTFLER